MKRFASLVGSALRSLVAPDRSRGGNTRQPRADPLLLEHLENRLVPSVAHSVAGSYLGQAGTFTLANTGALTFTATGGGTVQGIDNHVAAFNVDKSGALWDLEVGGALWMLNTAVSGAWTLQDLNVGAFSLSANGTVSDLQENGTLWRWTGGVSGNWNSLTTPLLTGITRADVDAADNVYALKDGTLFQFAPGSSTPNNINATATPNPVPLANGGIVSFSVGSDTVAFQCGSFSGNSSGIVFVSYNDGAAGSFAQLRAVNGGSGTVSPTEYGVTADGSVLVVSPSNAVAGQVQHPNNVELLPVTAATIDVNSGTLVTVNGANATWFQISPDGTWAAFLANTTASSPGNLSAYTIAGGTLGTEDKLETGNLASGFGIANDNRVYEFQQTSVSPAPISGTLLQWTPTATGGVSDGGTAASATVNTAVTQWALGPNGQVTYLNGLGAMAGSYFWANDNGLAQLHDGPGFPSGAAVAQFVIAPNGEQYDLETNGKLWGFTSAWTLLDGPGSIAGGGPVNSIAVSSNSELFEIDFTSASNGVLWKATRTNSGWLKVATNALVNLTPGILNQMVALPDGAIITIVSGALDLITTDSLMQLSVGQSNMPTTTSPTSTFTWGIFFPPGGASLIGTNNPGLVPFSPALNPLDTTGNQFSTITSSITFPGFSSTRAIL